MPTSWRIAICAALIAACQPPQPPVTAPPISLPVESVAEHGLTYQQWVPPGTPEGTPLPMVIGIHGLGDKPDTFIRMFQRFDQPIRVIAPKGPEPYTRGSSWFRTSVRSGDPAVIAAEVAEASDRLAALVYELTYAHPTQGKPVVMGFSQGGMLSYAMAVRHPDAISGAVPMSGWLPEPLWPTVVPPDAPPIYGFHGDADTVLPLPPTQAGVDHLKSIGWPAQLQVSPGVGHSVSREMRAGMFQHVRDLSTAR